jgi:hypothetical protein
MPFSSPNILCRRKGGLLWFKAEKVVPKKKTE